MMLTTITLVAQQMPQDTGITISAGVVGILAGTLGTQLFGYFRTGKSTGVDPKLCEERTRNICHRLDSIENKVDKLIEKGA